MTMGYCFTLIGSLHMRFSGPPIIDYSLLIMVRYVHRSVITLRPKQNGRNFPDDIFKWIFLNENV